MADASNPNDLIFGTITRFYTPPDRRNYGFASAKSDYADERILIRAETLRSVSGTALRPVLGDHPSTQTIMRAHRGRQIVMRVSRGDEGLWAPAWGILPI